MKLFKNAALACALVGAIALQACGDEIKHQTVTDIGAGFPDVTGDVPVADTKTEDLGPDVTETPDVPTNPNAVRALKFDLAVGDDNVTCQGVTHCTIVLSYASDRTLKVVYTEDGDAVAGQLVKFKVENESETGIGSISSLSAYTDEQGVAAVETSPGAAKPGQFAVRAYVDNSEIPPLYFDVVVSPKGQVPLTIASKYSGSRPVTTYQAYLYRQTAQKPYPCTEVLTDGFKGTASLQSPITNIAQTWKIPELEGLESDGTQDYTVYVTAKNPQQAIIAWGCSDAAGSVQWGIPKTITVQLEDRPPLYAGTYTVTSHFDFVSALPDSVKPWVYGVLDFFEDPVGQILVLGCMAGNEFGVGALDDLCGLVFNDVANPNINDMTSTGKIATDILKAIIAGLSEDTIWGDVLNSGADISQMLKHFQIDAYVTFAAEPDAEGYWTEEQTAESWHTVYVKWSLNANCDPGFDPSCGLMQFSLESIQQNPVQGKFSARVENTWDLTIDKHALNLSYGALLNYIIEKQLLPLLAGDGTDGLPVIDTYEELIQSLVAGKECLDPSFGMTCCAKFGKDIASKAGNIGESVVTGMCDALVSFGADFLRDQLEGLDTSTGDAFKIGTAETCKFYDVDNDMKVDNFGTIAKPCTWEVDLKLFGATTTIDATFWATRLE